MLINMKIEDDVHLRNEIRNMILGQVRSIIRDEMKDIVANELRDQAQKLVDGNFVEKTIKNRITEATDRSYIRELAETEVKTHVKKILDLIQLKHLI